LSEWVAAGKGGSHDFQADTSGYIEHSVDPVGIDHCALGTFADENQVVGDIEVSGGPRVLPGPGNGELVGAVRQFDLVGPD
jgi:hypothetical protein